MLEFRGIQIASLWDVLQSVVSVVKPAIKVFRGEKTQQESEQRSANGEAIKTNPFGQKDEQAILYLMSMYGVPTEAMGESLKAVEVTSEQRKAVGYLLAQMTDGEGGAFKRAIARGNEQQINVKIPVSVDVKVKDKKGQDKTITKLGSHEYAILATIRGSHVLRSIGQDIISAGATEDLQKAKAETVVQEFRKVGILSNLSDSFGKMLGAVKSVLPGRSVYSLYNETALVVRLGKEGYQFVTRSQEAERLWEVVENQDSPAAKAKAERQYWRFVNDQADFTLSETVQLEAARQAGRMHPNRKLVYFVAGTFIVVGGGFAIIILIAL